MVGEAFRRKGYSVQENMIGGADGGIDLVISKDGKQHIVQCKQWRSSKVGVSIVREMFGVLTASNAKSVYIVTSGEFTKDAIKFAHDLLIELINGNALLRLISDVQNETTYHQNTPRKPVATTEQNKVHGSEILCPKCASQLVKRTAKKSVHMGNEFLGCSSFPSCRYIQQL